MEPTAVLEVRDITKRFPGVVANESVSLAFRAGEIHVLLGENGAGKSTLMGILAGMQQPDAGEILVEGRTVHIGAPRESLDLGIGTVFQHVLLVPSLTVIENLLLGGSWWRRQDRAGALARFEALRSLLDVEIDPDARVAHLSLGQQQQVEIIRALWRDGRVLILDEPTSMLTPQGVKELGAAMRRLRDQGVAVIFITHKLKEAFELGDRISVLRLGRVAGEIPPERLRAAGEVEVTDAVIRLMFGTLAGHGDDAATLLGEAQGRARAVEVDRSGPPLLEVDGLSTGGEAGACHLRGVAFEVWPGEILGIAGVDGNGQKDLAEVLAGQRPASAGRIGFDGRDVTRLDVVARRRLGIRYISDERLGEGSVPALSVATNLVLKQIGEPPHWQRGITLWGRIFGHARERIAEFDIRTPSEHTPIGRLSGGNIQKAILARELSRESRLAIFSKPTYGLDLHNTQLARRRILAAARSGLATVIISTELDELMELSDRIAVLYQGELRGIVANAPGAEERIGLLMTGGKAAA